MTKKQMIQTIQQQEAAAYLELKQVTRDTGSGSIWTEKARSSWYAIDRLARALGIESDTGLPEMQQAIDIMIEQESNPNI
jgi:hypothetical protein